ncbi:hypothetical protein A2U01_0095155, partial [Trifolium medium]|nr:hypothetical protein [Trifolium medium]
VVQSVINGSDSKLRENSVVFYSRESQSGS